MDNAWFYTLSTSAQVLAALAGLFAVFVVWKIQSFEPSMLDLREAMIRMIDHISSNTKDYKKKNIEELNQMSHEQVDAAFQELLKIREEEPNRIGFIPTGMTTNDGIYRNLDKFTRTCFKNFIDLKLSILNKLRKILVVNFATIAFCIIALTSPIHLYWLLFCLTIAVLYSLYIIGRGIYEIALK